MTFRDAGGFSRRGRPAQSPARAGRSPIERECPRRAKAAWQPGKMRNSQLNVIIVRNSNMARMRPLHQRERRAGSRRSSMRQTAIQWCRAGWSPARAAAWALSKASPAAARPCAAKCSRVARSNGVSTCTASPPPVALALSLQAATQSGRARHRASGEAAGRREPAKWMGISAISSAGADQSPMPRPPLRLGSAGWLSEA